jgi:hypothetical protein
MFWNSSYSNGKFAIVSEYESRILFPNSRRCLFALLSQIIVLPIAPIVEPKDYEEISEIVRQTR